MFTVESHDKPIDDDSPYSLECYGSHLEYYYCTGQCPFRLEWDEPNPNTPQYHHFVDVKWFMGRDEEEAMNQLYANLGKKITEGYRPTKSQKKKMREVARIVKSLKPTYMTTTIDLVSLANPH